MVTSLTRRHPLAVLAAIVLVPLFGCAASEQAVAPPAAASPNSEAQAAVDRLFAQLETTYDARLGVYALDTGTMQAVGYRADDRFAYTSTFKALLAAVVLKTSSDEELNRVIRYSNSDLAGYSPITKDHLSDGMTVRALCDAAVRYSDNTAANLLFRQIGGTAVFQSRLRAIGDDVTLSTRIEPDLNTAVPGDTRDTTTPRAFALDLKKFSLDNDVLPSEKRVIFNDWLKGNTTGAKLIRAGIPSAWTVGDKTGAGSYGTRNDIAVIWPAGEGAPIVMAIFSSRSTEDATKDDKLIADAAKVAFDEVIRKRGER